MKLTKYKIARIKSILPQEDIDRIEKEEKEGKFSSEIKSLLDQWNNKLAPKRLSKTKGSFGKYGTNRKKSILQNQLKLIEQLKKQPKEDIHD
jgi:hypothetical protein